MKTVRHKKAKAKFRPKLWKYKIDVSPMLSELSYSENIDPDKLSKFLKKLIAEVERVADEAGRKGDENVREALDDWLFSYRDILLDYAENIDEYFVSDIVNEDIDPALEELYDIGDNYRIWIEG